MTGDWVTPEEVAQYLQGRGPLCQRGPRPGGGHKYSAQPTVYDGRRYDSKTEARRAAELDLLVKCGEVLFWSPQPRFELGLPEIRYVADFFVIGRGCEMWVEDVKGMELKNWKRNKLLWSKYGPPYDLIVLKSKKNGWNKEIVPGKQ